MADCALKEGGLVTGWSFTSQSPKLARDTLYIRPTHLPVDACCVAGAVPPLARRIISIAKSMSFRSSS